jgi:hypothetical protein
VRVQGKPGPMISARTPWKSKTELVKGSTIQAFVCHNPSSAWQFRVADPPNENLAASTGKRPICAADFRLAAVSRTSASRIPVSSRSRLQAKRRRSSGTQVRIAGPLRSHVLPNMVPGHCTLLFSSPSVLSYPQLLRCHVSSDISPTHSTRLHHIGHHHDELV